MNKKYKFDRLIFDRYAVWYMEIPKDKNKIQEQLDEQILNNTTRNFYKSNNIFRGNRSTENQTQSRAA